MIYYDVVNILWINVHHCVHTCTSLIRLSWRILFPLQRFPIMNNLSQIVVHEDTYIDLPGELVLKIFSYLDAQELGCAGRVCWLWRRISFDQNMWKSLCLKDWSSVIKVNYYGSWRELYIRRYFIREEEKRRQEERVEWKKRQQEEREELISKELRRSSCIGIRSYVEKKLRRILLIIVILVSFTFVVETSIRFIRQHENEEWIWTSHAATVFILCTERRPIYKSW